MRRRPPAVPVLLAALAAVAVASSPAALRAEAPAPAADAAHAAWHHPLYLARGGTWRGRIAVKITNRTGRDAAGDPVSLTVGEGDGRADLAGTRAEAIRVVTADGTELLYGLNDGAGRPVREGPVPEGSVLTLPAEVAADASATYFIYFDNPDAWRVAEYLDAAAGLANGGVEIGDEGVPAAWRHDEGDARHTATWVAEDPHGGARCLKTVVAEGAEPTWIATRQTGIPVTAGARYRLAAWVRADDVKGRCGWYIHLYPKKGDFLASPMLTVAGGTFGWKQVSAEFAAPAEAVRATVGTVLRGAGTAWFDDVHLACLDPPALEAVASRPERMDLAEAPGAAGAAGASAAPPPHRATVRVLNFADRPMGPTLLASDLAPLAGRLRGPLDPASVTVSDGRQPVPHYVFGDTLLVAGQVPARAARTYYVSGTPRAAGDAQAGDRAGAGGERDTDTGADAGAAEVAAYARLLDSPHNLARNASFEAGGDLPDGWTAGSAKPAKNGTATARAGGGLFGDHCVRIRVPEGAADRWVGWHQSIAVDAGKTYVYAAWVKCEAIRGGSAALHAHCRTADGKMCAAHPYRSVGPGVEGTRGWTLLAGTLTMPADCATLGLHLTMNASGTLWHDGVVVAEAVDTGPARLAPPPPMPKDAPVAVWPVNAVVKVFRDDVPPTEPAPGKVLPARLTAARNEVEPLQLAVRSPVAVRGVGVRVEVDPPKGPGGAVLDDFETGVVGYVPIDHATSYYRSESPAWHRKFPQKPAGCDGWAGWWPDPLVPGEVFAVEANRTQPVWVTFRVPKDAPAGEYRGAVRLTMGGKALARVPLEVRVWDFALPDKGHFTAIYDLRLRNRWWRDDFGGDRSAYVRRFWKFMSDRRVSPHRIEPEPVIRYKDGQVEADFTAYDEAAEYYFNVLGLPHTYTPSYFYCFGWGRPPKKAWGEAPYEGAFPYDSADRSRLRPEFKRAYQACLRAYWDHMKAKGWADRVVLYISDEPHDQRHEYVVRQMQALCAMIHEVAPEIPIYSSTWHHQPKWDGSLDVWGVGHQGRTPLPTIEAIRARGDRVWFTTDGQMCTDTPSCAVERLLPHYAFAHGAEAYEFWGVDWFTYNPYAFGWHAYIHQSDRPGSEYYVRYPNGDGYLTYPGSPAGRPGPVSTVRLEQAREGVEDYEYLYLLKERIRKAKAAGRAGGDAAVTEAGKVLRDAAALVPIPNAGGRYSTKILPDPDAVFRLKERLGRAIEALGG